MLGEPAHEPCHDELVLGQLARVLPADIARIAHVLAGSCTVMLPFDEDAERRNDPFVKEIFQLTGLHRDFDLAHREKRFHPGQYHRKNSGHGDYLDRDEWDWYDCCGQDTGRNNNFANWNLIGCRWRGVPQPELQVQLDSLQSRIDALIKQVVCSSCSGGHSGRFCQYMRCGFCLNPTSQMYGKYDCSRCGESRDRALAPQRARARKTREAEMRKREAADKAIRQQANRERRKKQRRLEPCGKFYAGLCKRGDKCSRSHA